MDISSKIKKIEALIAGAKSEGERQAAKLAKARLKSRIESKPLEYAVRLDSRWKKKLFQAVAAKHGFQTYRYARQKTTTAMIRVDKSFMEQVLWPEFKEHAAVLDKLSQEILSDLITKVHDVEENEEVIVSGEIPLIEETSLT